VPGTILRDDWQTAVTDRLQQHARDTLQAVQQANQPPLQSPSLPNPQIDPNAIVQSLQQHAQDTWQAVQQANQQAPLQGVQIDPNDVTARLQQHAQDAFQSVDQNVQSIGTGLQNVQQAVQPAVQAAQQGAQDANQPPLQGAVQPAQPTGPSDQVDSSSHAAFVSSLQPYADKWSKITGIPSDYLMAWAASESNWGKAGNALFGIKQSSQPGTAQGLTSATWEQGQGATTDTFANYNSPDQAFQALDQFLQGSRYRDVYTKIRGGQITPDQFMQGINAAGYATDPIWGQKIGQIAANSIQPLMGNAKQAVQGAVEAGKQAVQNILPGVSQFSDKQLTNAEAYAACGPAAAVRFAQAMGRNPTLREATDLAKTVGWTEDSGMAGLQSESKLFTEMGVAHRVLGPDWQAFGREAQSGNPVTLSTPGHYFTADAFDPASGAFHVGQSGLDLKGGSEWMTPAQMEQRMGALQGGLVADHPGTPSPSPISQGPGGLIQRAGQVVQQAVQQGGRAIGEGLQSLDDTIKTISSGGPSTGAGQVVAAFDQRRQDLADQIGQVPGQIQEAFGPGSALATGRIGEYLPTGAIAKTPLGGALETMTAPDLMSHDELLRTPEADTARTILEQSNARAVARGQAPTTLTDAEVAEATRTLLTGHAYAMTGEGAGIGREPLPAAAAGEAPATRMFHGTGSTFDQVNPGRLSEDSLFGPGYYLTSDPRVAGGTVQPRTEPLTPVQQSLVDRGLLNPENARSREGSVISPGYAQEMAPSPETVDMLADRATKLRQALQNPSLPESGRAQLEGLLTKAEADVRQAAGPNVRAVDVPQDLKLFDLERPLTQDEATRLAGALEDWNGRRWDTTDPEVRSEVQSWTTPDADGKSVYDLILGETGGNKGETNLILSRAGFDGIQHTGGRIMPMVDETGQTIEHNVNVIFPDSVNKVRNAISGTQGGQINTAVAARLGGAAAGGAVGYQTTPEDASPEERIARTAAGVGLGLAAGHGIADAATFRPLDQQILKNLRDNGLLQGPSPVRTPRGFIPNLVQGTKQSILSNPVGMVGNVIGNTIELARTPASLALGGRVSDAMAATHAVMRGLGVASDNALSALAGSQRANLAEFGSAIPLRSPIYRILSASDAFTRTLGELQGMSVQANRLLHDAGISPSDPAAAGYLADHAADLYHAGAREGAQSVFSQLGNIAAGRTGLDTAFSAYGRYKDGLLASPSLRDQGLGALLDVFVPFSGIPVRLLGIAANRLPPGTQLGGIGRMAQAVRAGDSAAFQQHFGSTMLETMIQVLIAKNIADGNITGPEDPDHPSMVRVGGEWHGMNDLGGYALPMQIMAAWAEGYEKARRNQPAGTPVPEGVLNQFGAALNASLKPFVKAVPGMDMLKMLNQVGEGGFTGAALSAGQDITNRIGSPGIARFAENLMDPVARDINRKGVQSLWEGPMSNWPGLANYLPEKIDPTTGEVLHKTASSGPGMLLGARADVESPLTIEANRLKKAGFDTAPPTTYPDSVSIQGAEVKLKPDEQRKVAEITGKQLGALAARLDQPDYQKSTDPRKAQLMQAYLNAIEKARIAAVRDVLGVDELRTRLLAGQKTAGRLNVQATPPTFTPFVSSSSLSAQEQQAVGAGR
jgi:flagellar protein FlgJ